jgi:uncharacterized protein
MFANRKNTDTPSPSVPPATFSAPIPEEESPPPIQLPADEAALVRVVSDSQQESAAAENDMQRGGIKRKRDTAICSMMSSRSVNDWIGTIETIDANSDGKGVLALSLAKDITVKTWNNDFSDMRDGTLIEPNTSLFRTVSSMKVGRTVRFSGHFFGGSEGDCLKEGSMTLSGKLRAPEFIFLFSNVSSLSGPTSSSSTSSSDSASAADVNNWAANSARDRKLNLANSIRGQGLRCDSVGEDTATTVSCLDGNAYLNYEIAQGAMGPVFVLVRPKAEASAPSFDCALARSPSEHLICADPELAAVDVDLAALYKKAKGLAQDKAAFTRTNQSEWQRRESSCLDRSCLIEWYAQRRSQLSQVIATAGSAMSNAPTSSSSTAPEAPASPALHADMLQLGAGEPFRDEVRYLATKTGALIGSDYGPATGWLFRGTEQEQNTKMAMSKIVLRCMSRSPANAYGTTALRACEESDASSEQTQR